jgi:hypothetical protein
MNFAVWVELAQVEDVLRKMVYLGGATVATRPDGYSNGGVLLRAIWIMFVDEYLPYKSARDMWAQMPSKVCQICIDTNMTSCALHLSSCPAAECSNSCRSNLVSTSAAVSFACLCFSDFDALLRMTIFSKVRL